MDAFKKIDPKALDRNAFTMLGDEWALVTAQKGTAINTMTISWGGMGILWNRPVVTVYIRPERYTYDFVEAAEGFSVSFYGPDYREALSYCGTVSGRDHDKIAACGFTLEQADGIPYFAEAKTVLICKKIYADALTYPQAIGPAMSGAYSGDAHPHRMYIAEIVQVLRR